MAIKLGALKLFGGGAARAQDSGMTFFLATNPGRAPTLAG